jgi:hypothetical protein
MPMRRPESLLLALLSLCSGACAEVTRQTAPPHEQLTYVAILTRHGVRSPTWPAERLNQYSTRQWPDFGVPPGFLTPHGTKLMELVGVYDRAYLAQAGLLSASGCDDTGRVFIWADTDQRTIETGRALASGMAPGCQVEVRSLPEGTDDPLFSPIALGIAHADRTARRRAPPSPSPSWGPPRRSTRARATGSSSLPGPSAPRPRWRRTSSSSTRTPCPRRTSGGAGSPRPSCTR